MSVWLCGCVAVGGGLRCRCPCSRTGGAGGLAAGPLEENPTAGSLHFNPVPSDPLVAVSLHTFGYTEAGVFYFYFSSFLMLFEVPGWDREPGTREGQLSSPQPAVQDFENHARNMGTDAKQLRNPEGA